MRAQTIEGGFASPVFDAQTVFRAVMDAMAQPGTVRPLTAATQPPAPLSIAAAAVALTLCDHDTPLWLDRTLADADAVAGWLGFHTGAPVVADLAQSRFAIIAEPERMPPLERFAPGTQDYPDRSATLILQVKSLGKGEPLTLRGPGIESEARLAPAFLPDGFFSQWRSNNALFPRGIDLILAASEGIACLPRTTRIEATET